VNCEPESIFKVQLIRPFDGVGAFHSLGDY